MTLFLAGFLASSLIWAGLILIYYLRARRRVQTICSEIARYQAASKVVGEAAQRFYPKDL